MSNAHELVRWPPILECMLKLPPPIGMKLLESAETLRQIPKAAAPAGHPHHGPDLPARPRAWLDHGRAGR